MLVALNLHAACKFQIRYDKKIKTNFISFLSSVTAFTQISVILRKMSQITCGICTKFRGDATEYLKHLRVHKNNSRFECAFVNCEILFNSFASYRKHFRQRHIGLTKNDEQLKCLVFQCGFEERSSSAITKHAMQHISAGQPVFCPRRCRTSKPFATAYSLRIHNLYHHGENCKKKSSLRNTSASPPHQEEDEEADEHAAESALRNPKIFGFVISPQSTVLITMKIVWSTIFDSKWHNAILKFLMILKYINTCERKKGFNKSS